MERRIRQEILGPDRPLSRSSLRSARRRLLQRLTRLTRPRFQTPPRSEEAFPSLSLFCRSAFLFALNKCQVWKCKLLFVVYLDFSLCFASNVSQSHWLSEWRRVVGDVSRCERAEIVPEEFGRVVNKT
jgi:hypothetical protein